jgi:hypothetical protein
MGLRGPTRIATALQKVVKPGSERSESGDKSLGAYPTPPPAGLEPETSEFQETLPAMMADCRAAGEACRQRSPHPDGRRAGEKA